MKGVSLDGIVMKRLCEVGTFNLRPEGRKEGPSKEPIRAFWTKGPALHRLCGRKNRSESHSVESCPLFMIPMPAHGILQVRILEWAAFSFSRGSSQHRIEPRSPSLPADSLPAELPERPMEGKELSNFKALRKEANRVGW